MDTTASGAGSTRESGEGTAAPDLPDVPDVPDEITRSIRVSADAGTVFALISEPGWFINDGAWTEHEILAEPDGTTRVTDPVHGTFHIATDVLEPPRRAVFRWLGGDPGELVAQDANTVEFTVEPDGDGVILTVTERGFASRDEDAATRRRRYEDNSSGWELELGIAREVAQQRAR